MASTALVLSAPSDRSLKWRINWSFQSLNGCNGRRKVTGVKHFLLMVAMVTLVGCGKTEGPAKSGENNSSTKKETPTKATDKNSTTANSQPNDSSNPVAGRELTPAERKLVGTYMSDQQTIRRDTLRKAITIILLNSGKAESWSQFRIDPETGGYIYDTEPLVGKWRIEGKELHITGEIGGVAKINPNGSLTGVAEINKNGERRTFNESEQPTFIKVRTQISAKTLQWTFGAGGRDIAAWKGQSAQSVWDVFGKPAIAKPYGQGGGAWTFTGMDITDAQGKKHTSVTFIMFNGAVATVQSNTP